MPNPLIVTATIDNYWYEDISREEGLRRLDTQNLPQAERDELAATIPTTSRHYLIFENGVFREYLDRFDGQVKMLLLLPMKQDGNSYTIQGYIDSTRQSGIVRSVFSTDGIQLFENGNVRSTFQKSVTPVNLSLDVSFVDQALSRSNSNCCKLCKWVHSVLDIHIIDALCCLGTCGSPIWL